MPKTIALFACAGVQLLDVAGPLDVFAEANRQLGKTYYRLLVVATARRAVTSSAGSRLLPDLSIHDPMPRLDTLLVAGAPHMADAPLNLSLLAWLKRQSRRTSRYGSVCSGAFLLAAAGLLDGRRVTTHWNVAQTLAQRYPAVDLQADALYLRDGPVCTAAGVTAGLDLALALVEEDLGRALAQQVASQLVMFFKRPGGQLQFSRQQTLLPAGRSALQELQRYIHAHPAADLSLAALAGHAGLSTRHLARIFQQETGTTPASYVEMARVEAARRLLEGGNNSPKKVASACGYADANGLRRAFMRRIGVTPADYRRQHQSLGVARPD